MLGTYFTPLEDHLGLACKLPVAGLHVDAVRAGHELQAVLDWLAAAPGTVHRHPRRPQHLACRPGPGPGHLAARAGAAWRAAVDCAVLFAAARAAGPVRRHRGGCRTARLAGRRAGEAGRAEHTQASLDRRRRRRARRPAGRTPSGGRPCRQPACEEPCRGPAPGGAAGRCRPALCCLPVAPGRATGPAAAADVPHHHHRLVSADRRDPRRTRCLQAGRPARGRVPPRHAARDRPRRAQAGRAGPGRAGARRGRAQ